MPLELFVSRRAARDVERIVQWWAVNRPAAPGAVRQDLQAALNLLLVQPDVGVRVNEAHNVIDPRDTREFLIRTLQVHRMRMKSGVGEHLLRNWPTSY